MNTTHLIQQDPLSENIGFPEFVSYPGSQDSKNEIRAGFRHPDTKMNTTHLMQQDTCSENLGTPEFVSYPSETQEIRAGFLKLEQKINNLEKLVKDSTSKILAQMSILTGNMNVRKRTFPISTFAELGQLDSDAETNPEEFIRLLKTMIGDESITIGLRRLLSDDLLFKMNYSGKMGQVGLMHYSNFTNLLYEALKNDDYSLRQYKDDLRSAFNKAKNKVYKYNHEQKKRKRNSED
ncbi:uncharacterized protein LOC108092312 [Drosophila ficusphila]|uniref:uncharacterized protein LOC108092312 n=1 Tax=Drosophila ficusphila TaxID=30025 RepID=UPI0007E7307A|nr:uncharacterized protein LOC108092312 [Drosophila ficusphila]